MQVGVIGWWNYDNQGDLAMLASLRKGLAPHRVIALDVGFPAWPDTLYRLNRLDYVILGGGTLIAEKPGLPFDTFDTWKDQLERPLGVVGLGVDPIHESYRADVNALMERTRFFFVRDQASRRLLGRQEIRVAPDLTFAYPLPLAGSPVAGERKRPLCGVNLRKSSRFDPQPWMETIAGLPVEIRGIPLSSFESFAESALLRQLDPGCASAYAPHLYEELDLMIGVAFHSVVFAVQAGVPVIAVAYAPKVRHFMEDIGLAHYVLSAGEWARLPELVDEILDTRSQVRQQLQEIRERLQQEAQHMFHTVRVEIEQSRQTRRRSTAAVTVIVMGSGDADAEERTLSACLTQTYTDLEILFVPQAESARRLPAMDDSRVTLLGSTGGYGTRLRRALAGAQGEYVTWIDAGDWLAEDALDCLVARMDEDSACDVLYADYWLVSEANMPVGTHYVPGVEKLYRRDVVGPCFLARKQVLAGVHNFPVDSPLPTYRLWLELSSRYRLRPFHAPLMYSGRQPRLPQRSADERATRRDWRKNWPVWRKAIWCILDSDFSERCIVQPAARLGRFLRRVLHARYK